MTRQTGRREDDDRHNKAIMDRYSHQMNVNIWTDPAVKGQKPDLSYHHVKPSVDRSLYKGLAWGFLFLALGVAAGAMAWKLAANFF